jgi:ParB family chromosome partitioning protein
MAKKRASVSDNIAMALGTPDILDQILDVNPDTITDAPQLIPIEQIDPNPYQTRTHFDPARLDELATAISAQGFLGYLLARKARDRYQIAYGERRLRASRLAELEALPLIIRDFTDLQMMEVSVTENVIREDLKPIEEALAYQQLVDVGYSQREIGRRIGKSSGHLSTILSLLKYPDVREAVEYERVGVREANEITKVDDLGLRKRLLDRVPQGELNREALVTAVKQIQAGVLDGNLEGLGNEHTRLTDSTISRVIDPIQAAIIGYDPRQNLRTAISRLEKIRPEHFMDLDSHIAEDVHKMIEDLVKRGQFLLDQLDQT